MSRWDTGVLHKAPEHYAEEERCSHCCERLTKGARGGMPNGQGVYCRSCYRRHVKGKTKEWCPSKNCPHCTSAGLMQGWLYIV